MRTIQRWPVLGIYVGPCLLTPPWAHLNVQQGTGCDSHACRPSPGGERGLCERKDQRHRGSNSHLSLRIQEWRGPSAHGDSRRGGSGSPPPTPPPVFSTSPARAICAEIQQCQLHPSAASQTLPGPDPPGQALMNCTGSPSSCNKLVHLTVHSEKRKLSDEM